ncbi:endonuclease domain-containing protein [Sphingomonas profundi]|uniref:endonuclease domain-containing protein n=1 Tax=Alterirhizorhabdus profundi TaxID=2681549 RepID=UPI001E6308E3|nr:endonuclease domain-containing protein [Sphingomonas profundi]
MTGYAPHTLKRAKEMRRAPTEAERRLWTQLRGSRLGGAKFRRQQPIGPYIADFVCQQRRLIVEADGSQHVESGHDARRDAYLIAQGYRIVRFWNNDVMTNPQGVEEAIRTALACPHPPAASLRAPLSLEGRGVWRLRWLTNTTSSSSVRAPAAMSRRSGRRSWG